MPDPIRAHLEQDSPVPVCGSENDFTRVWIARGLGDSQREAYADARDALEVLAAEVQNAETAHTADEADATRKRCPGCEEQRFDVADLRFKKLGHVRLDGRVDLAPAEQNQGPHVAYMAAAWDIRLKCKGEPGNQAELAESEALTQIHHRPPAGCGETRMITGCVLAQVIGNGNDRAHRVAVDRARETAIATRDAFDYANACPGECGPPEVGDEDYIRTTTVKRQHIQQADPEAYVAYVTAVWRRSITCPEAEEDDGDKGKPGK